ncbi:hypothetical protein [Manganibacter manganicus]|uniref:Uncharacterized protein n=1 Tax=Manganibacter manganicus TaxID=1873176 RepID=A0A1V8RWJ2_9HYPH|nr:hypothetical protein [Pseudaminobacter manganicus]OQM77560.1 hypothetical protein BFN67_01615 [Pseudaminobacter manganicus]
MNTIRIEYTSFIVGGFDATREEYWNAYEPEEIPDGEDIVTEVESIENSPDGGVEIRLAGVYAFTPTNRQFARLLRSIGIKELHNAEDVLFRPLTCRVDDGKVVRWYFPDMANVPDDATDMTTYGRNKASQPAWAAA